MNQDLNHVKLYLQSLYEAFDSTVEEMFRPYRLLAEAMDREYDSIYEARKHLQEIEKEGLDDKIFLTIYEAVFLYVVDGNRTREVDLYTLFQYNYKKLLGENAEIIKFKNDPSHIPDFWVKLDEELIPVEIKLGAFNSTALKQLQRYMNFYKSPKGIAIGESLKTKLPENIMFFPTSSFVRRLKND